MRIELLNQSNLKECTHFEKEARETDPGILYGNFDETAFYEKTLKYLKEIGIENYFLIAAENEEAQRFYKSFNNASIKRQQILEKRI